MLGYKEEPVIVTKGVQQFERLTDYILELSSSKQIEIRTITVEMEQPAAQINENQSKLILLVNTLNEHN